MPQHNALNPSQETRQALDRFVQTSAILTGFSSFDLYGTGQAQSYFAWMRDVAPDATDALIKALDDLPCEPEAHEHAVRTRVMSDPSLGPVARSLIKLWYLGQWERPDGSGDAVILSGDAYQEGLVWRAIGAHPQGAKQQGFGAWAEPPDI